MRRISIVLAGFAIASIAAGSRLSGQSASASLSVSVTVSNSCTVITAPGTVAVTCAKGAPVKVGLNTGSNTQDVTRRMARSTNDYLTYELYQDTPHAFVWGNTEATALGIAAAPNQDPRTFSVYGRVVPAQTAAAGNYTDTVTATVNF